MGRKKSSKVAKEKNPTVSFSQINDAEENVNIIRGAQYDAATISDLSRNMFLHCDNKSADASNITSVRRRLREFARKEVANNSYARGLVLIVSSDMIGTGPRLQIEDDLGCNEAVEAAFNAWAAEIRLDSKLRTGKTAKMVDGETFGFFYKDKKLTSSSKLNFRFIEGDQVESPVDALQFDQEVDGIDLDENGDPICYYVLKEHPGAAFKKSYCEYEKFPADMVIHWFREDRPGQHRGVSEFAPALPLFYQLRRYTLASVDAAETAASIPMVLYTDSPNANVYHNKDHFARLPLKSGMMTALTEGWKLGQVKAEQPTTNYPDFKREILAEIARCFCVPVNVLSGDSSKHNYASGRLDFQSYYKMLNVERKLCEIQVLNKLFAHWYEQTYFRGVKPRFWVKDTVPRVSWFWDELTHVDPVKEANAQRIRLESLTTTFKEECQRQGVDWITRLAQIEAEQKEFAKRGIDVNFYKGKAKGK